MTIFVIIDSIRYPTANLAFKVSHLSKKVVSASTINYSILHKNSRNIIIIE